MVAPLVAANAYAAVQAQATALSNAAAGAASGSAQAQAAGGPGFAEMLKSAYTDAVGASRNAEQLMTAQVQGKANLVDVVTAISSAETSLQTVIAVRDQVIAAYQQVMQMQI
ncbi:MAG TPA: flagellar hook-basal body complex protein FliE [Caulobacteraceae bacterium]|nr:flagellar hook-basal body complex protein FliE [Caulobacteraceae bacterium]